MFSGLLVTLSLFGCSESSLMSGDFGLTPGGQQGIDYARDLVERGQVPEAADLSVDGLLNDHDMPIDRPCDDTVCVNLVAGTGRIEVLDASAVLVQVGFDTNISPETWVRPATEFTVVIDVSGSMSAEIAPIQSALLLMLDQLTASDTMAIVTYGATTKIVLQPTPGDERTRIENAIGRLASNGSTNMEAGLKKGYELAVANHVPGRNARVMLFTDEQPNVGATDAESFEGIIRNGADEGIGLSLLGIGNSFGSGLAYDMSQMRGGNFKYLATNNQMRDVFSSDDFGFLVTPIAYALDLRVETTSLLEAAYNVQAARETDVVEAYVATLFLSEGSGASILQLEASAPAPTGSVVASGALSFETVDGVTETREIEGTLGDEAGGYEGDAFGEVGTRKAAALVNEGLTAIAVVTEFHEGGVSETTEATAWATVDRLLAEAEALEDEALLDEAAFLEKLMHNARL